VTGNSFANSYIGAGKLKRAENDRAAAGMILQGTQDVTVVGNLFAGLRPRAVTVQDGASRILVTDNVLADTESDLENLDDALIRDNME
jgi:hypothetical protein